MGNKVKVLPGKCPSCSEILEVTQLRCAHCETTVEGRYPLPFTSRLDVGDQEFILQFVKFSGSLKEMAKLLGVSYPTVRNRLNEIIEKLKSINLAEPENETET